MKGYLFANVHVANADGYEAYRCRTREIVERFGGRFLVRGGKVTVLEGDPGIARLVVLEFPSPDDARAFYDSPDYQAIMPIRTGNSSATFFIVEGYDDDGR